MSSVETCAKTGDRSFIGRFQGAADVVFASDSPLSRRIASFKLRELLKLGVARGRDGRKQIREKGEEKNGERKVVRLSIVGTSELLTFQIVRGLCCGDGLFKLETFGSLPCPFPATLRTVTTATAVSQDTVDDPAFASM